MRPPLQIDPTLERLVRQLLLGRLDGLDAPGVAAFVSGWQSALELVARTDLLIPDAEPNVHTAVAELSTQIGHVQRACFTHDDA